MVRGRDATTLAMILSLSLFSVTALAGEGLGNCQREDLTHLIAEAEIADLRARTYPRDFPPLERFVEVAIEPVGRLGPWQVYVGWNNHENPPNDYILAMDDKCRVTRLSGFPRNDSITLEPELWADMLEDSGDFVARYCRWVLGLEPGVLRNESEVRRATRKIRRRFELSKEEERRLAQMRPPWIVESANGFLVNITLHSAESLRTEVVSMLFERDRVPSVVAREVLIDAHAVRL
jgi:hypothetical protein